MKKTLKSLFVILLILVAYYFLQVFTVIVMTILSQIFTENFEQGVFIQKYGEIAIIISILITLPVLFFISKLIGRDMLDVCNFQKIEKKKIFLAIILGISLNVTIFLAMNLLYSTPTFKKVLDDYMEFAQIYASGNFLLSIIAYGIMAPIIEEIMFRGFVLTELSDVMPAWGAVIIQGLIFGAYHLNEVQFFYASFIGIVLGFVYIWTDSLFIPIAAHMANNIYSSVMSKIDMSAAEDNQLINLFIVVVYIIVIGLGIFIVKHFKETKKISGVGK